MKAWHWSALGTAAALPLLFLFFVATAVGAAWGGPDISIGLLTWFVGLAIGTASIVGFHREQPWGKWAALAGALFVAIGTIVAVAMTGRGQPSLFALPAVFWIVAATWRTGTAPDAHE